MAIQHNDTNAKEYTEEFVGEAEWQGAPLEDRPAFLYVTLQARKKLTDTINSAGGNATRISRLRRQYAYEIYSIANTLQVGGIGEPSRALATQETWLEFESGISAVLATIRAEMRGVSLFDTVELPQHTKRSIEQHIEILKEKINKSNLSDSLKERLHSRIAAFEHELNKRKTSLPTLWLLAGALSGMGYVSDAAGFVAVVKEVTNLVSSEKAKELQREAEVSSPALAYDPPKQLEDHSGYVDRTDRDA